MRRNILLDMIKNHTITYPTPITFLYAWGIGSLLGLFLVLQILSGVFLAMHYTPHIDYAFWSVEHIMRDVPNGWFVRYAHSNGSSILFILLYAHIAKGLFYQSYKAPREFVWISGVVIFILMSLIAFLGYTLPWGQMSFWGATVITNIITAVPVIGEYIVVWIWGGFAINNATLNRFFSLHYVLSFVAVGLVIIHLVLLHEAGSSSGLGLDVRNEVSRFTPYFILKDTFGFLVALIFFLIIICFFPNFFGHPDNYIPASAIATPAHIVPEWYFLPFYSMLKSCPSKLGGAVFMIGAMISLAFLPWLDRSILTYYKFKFFHASSFMVFLLVVFLLGWLGSQSVSDNTMFLNQMLTVYYFLHLFVIIPALSTVELQTFYEL